MKYYWNQMYFFKLKQSPYKDKEPIICQYTNEIINRYKELEKSDCPKWYDKAMLLLKNKDLDFFNKTIKKISQTLHQNVSYRFKNTILGTLEVYNYSKKEGSFIKLTLNQKNYLKEYSIILSELLNYKWSQLLEKFNFQPKISSKVKGISATKIRRSNLTKYKDILLEAFKDGKIYDFYTGKEIKYGEVSIDHVIPWSFMYSDDIWNLVVTTKSYNSLKNNSIPDEEYILKLKERNEKLVNIISDKALKYDLEIAIKNDFVDKFYHDCRM